ncbi:hypothetical protein BASA60_011543 [Batrachochytrium salamandrivorans]|nr:hypothetical protein BASA60_011543 [Batrachochytrium salamandrivorans]
MKLSSFFVAAMVITSVNAGRFGKLWRKVKSRRVTRPSVTSSLEQSPVPDLMSDAVQRQMKDYPMIKHAFKNDEDHNDMLISMYNTKEEILQLANEIGPKCFKYIDNTEGEGRYHPNKIHHEFQPR